MLLDGGILTLDAAGDPNAVWVFQGGADLSVNVGSSVVLTGGAQACNVYWVMTSNAAIGGSANFVGTIMAGTSVTLGTDATLTGRALAANGNVTLLSNTITRPTCVVAGAGGVPAGDGSTSAPNGSPFAFAWAITALAVLIGAIAYVTRRRSARDA
jgi:hypothetical protein